MPTRPCGSILPYLVLVFVYIMCHRAQVKCFLKLAECEESAMLWLITPSAPRTCFAPTKYHLQFATFEDLKKIQQQNSNSTVIPSNCKVLQSDECLWLHSGSTDRALSAVPDPLCHTLPAEQMATPRGRHAATRLKTQRTLESYSPLGPLPWL